MEKCFPLLYNEQDKNHLRKKKKSEYLSFHLLLNVIML